MREYVVFASWMFLFWIRTWRFWVCVAIAFVLLYCLEYSSTLITFYYFPWETLRSTWAEDFLGWNWEAILPLGGRLVERAGAALLTVLGTAYLFALAMWICFSISGRHQVYAVSQIRSVLILISAGSAGWRVVHHYSSRPGSGAGGQLRQVVYRALSALPPDQTMPTHAKVHSHRLRQRTARQFPGLVVHGFEIQLRSFREIPRDVLDRDSVVLELAQKLRVGIFGADAVSISALVGPWGSGKSWIIDRVSPLLEFPDGGEQAIRTLRFNPWLYSDEEALFAGFSDLLLGNVSSWRLRRSIARGLKLIGPAAKMGPVDLSSLGEHLGEALGSPKTSEDLQASLSSGLGVDEVPVLVILDDVDRLSSSELLMLFKLLRLVGNTRRMSYLLAFDQDTLLHQIGQTELAMGNPRRARDYLDKFVEARHWLPPLTLDQIYAQTFNPILDYISKNQISVHARSREQLENVFTSSMTKVLTTKRSIDRFLNEALTLPSDLLHEVDFKDWCLSAFLRAQAPAAWDYVVENKEAFLGHHGFNPWGGKDAKSKFSSDLPTKLGEAGVPASLLKAVVDVLGAMFPELELSERSIFIPTSTTEESARRYGIGHDDYFDRYTWFSLPPNDVRDHQILELMRGLPRTPSDSVKAGELNDLLIKHPKQVFDRIQRHLSDQSVSRSSVMYFLTYTLPDGASVYGFVTDRSLAILTAGFLMEEIAPDDANTVFAWAATRPVGRMDLFDELLIRRAIRSNPPVNVHFTNLLALRTDALYDSLGAGACPTIETAPERSDFVLLRKLAPARAANLVTEKIGDQSWRPDDAIALYFQVFEVEGQTRFAGPTEGELRTELGESFLQDIHHQFEKTSGDGYVQHESEPSPKTWAATVDNARIVASGAVNEVVAHIVAENEIDGVSPKSTRGPSDEGRQSDNKEVADKV